MCWHGSVFLAGAVVCYCSCLFVCVFCLLVAVAGSCVNSLHPHVCTCTRSYSDHGVMWHVKEVTTAA